MWYDVVLNLSSYCIHLHLMIYLSAISSEFFRFVCNTGCKYQVGIGVYTFSKIARFIYEYNVIFRRLFVVGGVLLQFHLFTVCFPF